MGFCKVLDFSINGGRNFFMVAAKSTRERLAEARQFERAGELAEAAAIYQKIVDGDAGNQEAVLRLLVAYRKLKEYRKELAVINAALAVYARRGKDLQEKWIREHPKAAGAGKSILKQLGGTGGSVFGTDAAVSRLQKRKEFVNRRLGGKATVRTAKKKPKISKADEGKKKVAKVVAMDTRAAEKRVAAEQRKEAAEQRKRAAADAKAAKLARQKADREARLHPPLFIISLRYLVSLEKIDAAMQPHMAFLKKHYDNGDFLVSGRQVPRTGGIIIARGKDRDAVDRLMRNDPFVKKKLASVDIVEFMASQVGKGWHNFFSPL
jgi:uncharacterized protein YciI